MKITIDTKEDSKEDILRVIKMLQNLVESSSEDNVYTNQANIFEQPNPELPSGNVLEDFFRNVDNTSNIPNPEKKDEEPKVVEYY